jgi:hypothetical protein
MEASEIITHYELYNHGVKLLRRCLEALPHDYHLSLANCMHDFDSCNRTARGPKGVESQHGASDPFYRSVVLLYDRAGCKFYEVDKVL